MTKIHKRFGTGRETTYHWEECVKVLHLTRKPSVFFVGSANDIFSGEIDKYDILDFVYKLPKWHTYLFLTKNPKRYDVIDRYMWRSGGLREKDTFLGASIDGKHYTDFNGGHDLLDFISIEPLLAPVNFPETSARAVIVGGLTGHGSPYKHTPAEWVDDVVKQSLDSDMKVFIKDNLKDYIAPLEAKYGVSLRQLLWKVRG
jgi:protein gp37